MDASSRSSHGGMMTRPQSNRHRSRAVIPSAMANLDGRRPTMGSITDQFLLVGRVALVTGGSRGLGREMVRAFAQAGADVVIASRKQDACDDLAAEVARTTGRRAFPYA